jgi:lactoylglutathione lyase
MSSERGIDGVAGVLIWTERGRFEEMVRFYRDVLGLPVRTLKDGFVNFAWGTFRISVSVHEEVEGRSRDPLRVMVNLSVPEIGAEYERLRGQGVVFSRPPEAEEWGGMVATFTDPDGNTLQLMQLP